jgi:EmrB/QacA subfamily drug resistance transporter
MAPAPTRRRPGHPMLTLLAVTLGLMMVGLDSTIVSVANPAIGRHFRASLPGLRWVTDAYVLALALGLITGGKLGDLLGRKRLFLIGAAGFALASLACGLSGSLDALIGFRAAQGLFGAMMLPQTLAILRATFGLQRLAAAVGIWAMGFAAATAAGPIAGGLLVDHVSWRSTFFVNVPVGAVSALVGAWVIRESRHQSQNRRLDWSGIALLSGTLFALVWGLIDAEKQGWRHSHAAAWVLTAVVLLVTFIAWELREQRDGQPYIPLALFRSRQLSAGLVMVLTAFFALFAVLFSLTVYLQRAHGYTAVQAGVRLLMLTAVMGLAAAIAGAVVAKVGPRVPLLAGAVISAGGLVGLSQLGPDSSYSVIWPFLLLIGVGLGLIHTAGSHAIAAGAPGDRAGIAGGLQATAVQVGGLLGVSVLGSLAVPIPGGVSASTFPVITGGSLNAFTSGLDTAMVIAAAVTLVAGVGAFVSVRPTRGAAAAPASPTNPQPFAA